MTMRSAIRAAAVLAVAYAAGSAAAAAGGGDGDLNLYQMMARADLVVRVRVHEGALRHALVDVEEEILGKAPSRRLRIAFRHFNTARQRRSGPIVFPDGQEEILFLVPHPSAKRKEKNRDLFELLHGARGRLTLPAEGAGAILEALRRLVDMVNRDPASQIVELKRQIAVPNGYLRETALDELMRLDAATPELYDRLIPLVTDPAPGIRARSLRMIGRIFGSSRLDPIGDSPDQAQHALAAVIERARNDEDADVRIDAVRAMSDWPDHGSIEAELRAIAAGDPSQEVRFEAERALYRAESTRR